MSVRLIYAKAKRLSDRYRVYGRIEVASLGYHKEVACRHDAFGRWADTLAGYVMSLPAGKEEWSFQVEKGLSGSSERTRFAIRYASQDQTTYWDNNHGADYAVGTHGRGTGWDFPTLAIGSEVLCYKASLDSGQLSGKVAVKNLAYDKSVHVRYSIDDWATYHEVPARYVASDWNNQEDFPTVYEGELWEFSVGISRPVGAVKFAIRYAVAGAEYWDNNISRNYTVTPQAGLVR
ncbi:uncharacterized protein SOCE26_019060 [Sorangium cellulosum]|uniref:CBM21 domain-containing protein n=1 Tax=Sorangium cellulosum TaxID=56 RepID=A0A2L0EMK3_SORCE|nr:carbohydrate-binding protein [Sorangium cellulosum]AUX40505.1 uncharacterized protein SOCE26_019060 [Sorangium cellulosum]